MRILLRSAGVGVVATAVDVLMLLFLVRGCGLTAVQANLPALLVGITVQYLGNKYVAFGDTSRDHLRQGSLFALVEVGTLALNAIGFHLMVTFTRVPYPLVRILVTLAVYLGFSFPLWRLIFCPAKGRESGRRPTAGRPRTVP
jgi:putative flippase GtrA